MNLRSKYTANFKRDYVATSAVVVFFLIIISEIVLAVSLPLFMKKENVMAVSVRRLRLLESFDSARYRARAIKLKNETAQAELSLLVWNLNRMAEYLRNYAKYLSGDDLAALQLQLNEMSASLSHLQRGKPFSKEYNLDYTPYLERVMKKSGVIQ